MEEPGEDEYCMFTREYLGENLQCPCEKYKEGK